MALVLLAVVATLSSGTFGSSDSPANLACTPLQYVEYGKTGVLQCDFHNFFSVIWYNSSDHINDDPVLYFTQSVKSGPGYSSGEFDVNDNGSLVIKKVSLQHEHNFTVIKLDTSDDIGYSSYIQVIVIVKPYQVYPVIDTCGFATDICFTEVNETLNLTCYVRDSRPAPLLTWFERNDSGDFVRSSEVSILLDEITYTTQVTTKIVRRNIPSLELFVCKSLSPAPILQKSQSYVLIQNFPLTLTSVKAVQMFPLLHSKMKIPCSSDNISNIVWKLQRSKHKHVETILFGTFGRSRFSQIFLEGYDLDRDGSLVINTINFENEGLYVCVWGKGSFAGINTFNVTVYVPAVPKHPVVKECGDTLQYCIIQVKKEGRLTCKLSGIRPIVHLEWIIVSGSSSASITFMDETLQVESRQDAFDVVLTSRFVAKSMPNDRLTIKCKTSETELQNFNLSTQVDLVFTYESMNELRRSTWPFIILSAIAVIVVVIGLILLLRRVRKKGKNKQKAPSETATEDIPMLQSFTVEEKKKMFQQQLRDKYEDLYQAIQPIPFIRNQFYSVEKLFVEPEILWQHQNNTWKAMNSFNDIIKATSGKHTRFIIEGDPGYGKTTITLQMAHDWCKKKSAFKDVEILIIIRLRQLAGISSIYKAIKYFLLPKDSTLEEKDIENIMRNSTSGVIVLDGYDEYPDQDDNSDIKEIIERNMFQSFKVITTTRSFCLPKHFVANTARIKLTGFDDCAREKYITKTALYKSRRYKDEIKRRMYSSPVISDIFQVPLFFVMFTHIAYENHTFLNVKSVTDFFRYVIACIHNHMKRKTSDKNVNVTNLFENDHTKLDEVAFNSLRRSTTQTSWDKIELVRLIGVHLCDQYLRTGILIEEEVVEPAEKSQLTLSTPMIYKTKVRFFHKLFCEWYAAHHLARHIEKASEKSVRDCLEMLNPFHLHYVYRFACGLNEDAAFKIIEYLNGSKDGKKFACLCMLEQTGNFEKLEQDIKTICLNEIDFGRADSKLLHRSTIQLLEVASNRKIKIASINLLECINYDESEDGRIVLISEIGLPKLPSVQKIVITERRKTLSESDVECLLEYATRCIELKCLGFHWCMLPEILQCRKQKAALEARRLQVTWKPIEGSQMSFCLNLKLGKWEDENDGSKMTKMEYQQITSMFHSPKE